MGDMVASLLKWQNLLTHLVVGHEAQVVEKKQFKQLFKRLCNETPVNLVEQSKPESTAPSALRLHEVILLTSAVTSVTTIVLLVGCWLACGRRRRQRPTPVPELRANRRSCSHIPSTYSNVRTMLYDRLLREGCPNLAAFRSAFRPAGAGDTTESEAGGPLGAFRDDPTLKAPAAGYHRGQSAVTASCEATLTEPDYATPGELRTSWTVGAADPPPPAAGQATDHGYVNIPLQRRPPTVAT